MIIAREALCLGDPLKLLCAFEDGPFPQLADQPALNGLPGRLGLREGIAALIDKALYYGHFFCHVYHQDYVLKPGVDPVEFEHRLWALLDARGARYPAEHNVGHLYPAGAEQAAHFRDLDPSNRLNPGIGRTSRNRYWC